MSKQSPDTKIHNPAVVYAASLPVVLQPEKQLVSPNIVAALECMQPDSYLLDKRFIPGVAEAAETADIISVPFQRPGHKPGRHEIKSGLLNLQTDGQNSSQIQVVLKHYEAPDEAAHEYAIASYVARGGMGDIETFRPLGFYREGGGWSLITQKSETIKSLDSIFWNPEVIGRVEHPTVAHLAAKALGRAAVVHSEFHNKGWKLGDSQPDNMGWNLVSGKTVIFDFEDVSPLLSQQGLDEASLRAAMHEDILTFVTSLYVEEPPKYLDELIKEHFIGVYCGSRAIYHSLEFPKTSADEISELVNLERSFLAS